MQGTLVEYKQNKHILEKKQQNRKKTIQHARTMFTSDNCTDDLKLNPPDLLFSIVENSYSWDNITIDDQNEGTISVINADQCDMSCDIITNEIDDQNEGTVSVKHREQCDMFAAKKKYGFKIPSHIPKRRNHHKKLTYKGKLTNYKKNKSDELISKLCFKYLKPKYLQLNPVTVFRFMDYIWP